MGLNTTHGCFDGAYSSFGYFRKQIAKKIDVDLMSFTGFGGSVDFDTLDHPIKPLLNHSDCDGSLTVDEAKSIVKGIDMILEKMEDVDASLLLLENEDSWLKHKLIVFKQGAQFAIENNEEIEFQ
jgi:hypothetical protein